MTDWENAAPSPQVLRAEAAELLQKLEDKVRGPQGGVPTFHDNHVHRVLRAVLSAAPELASGSAPALARVWDLAKRLDQGRFVEHRVRRQAAAGPRVSTKDIDPTALLLSQGAWDCLQWRGLPLFKTVFDFAILPMLLWELRPATIIELGSGTGASALWLADLLQLFEIEAQVVSLDLDPPKLEHPKVRFLGGDCKRIAEALPVMELLGLGHPWLVIEDAHVNVLGVLRHLHPQIRVGDYLLVEDSAIKQDDLARFLDETRGVYKLDSRYTDFFGRNATACRDSIFRRS